MFSFLDSWPKEKTDRILISILIATTLSWVVYSRFNGLFSQGLYGHDYPRYYDYAKDFFRGRWVFMDFRPVAYFIKSIFIWITGTADYATQLAGALFDLGTHVLIFLTLFKSTRNPIWATAGVLIYSVLLLPVTLFTKGSIHPYAVFFVTLALYFAIQLIPLNQSRSLGQKLLYSFSMGLSISFAALTHEELILSTFAFFIGILFCLHPKDVLKRQFWLALIVCILGIFLPYWVCFQLFGKDFVISRYLDRAINEAGEEICFLNRCGYEAAKTIVYASFVKSQSLYYLSLPIGFLLILFKRFPKGHGVLAYLTPLVYLLFYLYFSQGRVIPRLFSPFIPVMVVSVVLTFHALLPRPNAKLTSTISILVALGYAIYNQPWEYVRNDPHPTRLVYDQLEGKVHSSARVLQPFTFEFRPVNRFQSGMKLAHQVYFGENAITYADYSSDRTFLEDLRELNVSFVVVPDDCTFPYHLNFKFGKYFKDKFDYDIMESTLISSVIKKNSLPPYEFTLEELLAGLNRDQTQGVMKEIWRIDIEQMKETLEKVGAERIARVDSGIDVYQIPESFE